MIGILDKPNQYIYGKLNQEVKTVTFYYEGGVTDTAVITVNQGDLTIFADVYKVPHVINIDLDGTVYTFDGSAEINLAIHSATEAQINALL